MRKKSRLWTIVGTELRLFFVDPKPVVLLVVLPLILAVFLRSTFEPTAERVGGAEASGAEQAIPGMAVMFAFFVVGMIGYAFFREHGWRTWRRLTICGARRGEVILAKLIVPLVALIVQFVIILGTGVIFMDLQFRASVSYVFALSLAFFIFLIAYSVALVALCHTMNQLNAYSTVGALLLGAFGGALTAFDDMPTWAQHVAPVTPSYWAMRGFRVAIFEEGGQGDMALSIAILLTMSLAMALVAVHRFRFDEEKISF